MIQFHLIKFNKKTFNIEAKILIEKNLEFKKIQSIIIDQLSAKFSFEERQFGQNVTLGEIMSTIQKVKGVIAVDVDKLFETGRRPQLNDVVYSSLQYSTRVRNNPQVDLLTINSDQGMVVTEIKQ